MTEEELQTLIEDATLDFTLGDNETALAKLTRATEEHPESFDAWHALTEVHFTLRNLDHALKSAEKAVALRPHDVHINTSLSRIWMERGEKDTAEHFGAQARMLSWKEELKQDAPKD